MAPLAAGRPHPALGAYDSGDSRVLAQHMTWIGRTGAGVIVYGWWGQGGYEDGLAERVMDALQRHVHL
ncbi:hypothetical protein [Nonomuraea sp. NPDC050643]|uniref:hypothetical protein n=1 Tax=Nonomuraea sp. NPDC050643 TaxID=3155660 RepID=UPI0033EF8DE8